jgi:rSAM/selenodomain-associated transferase 1
MATSRIRTDVTIAILAKAPVPGFAKTRLIPVLGAEGAARLQARMMARAIETALGVAPVTLWVTPDDTHPAFRALASQAKLMRQPEGDLGARMAAAVSAAQGPVLVMGTDCPALTPAHLRAAADTLGDGADVVTIPTADGGYALIGMNRLHPNLFSDMSWSVPTVMAETRRRLTALSLAWRELDTLWDVDTPEDLERLRAAEFSDLLSGEPQQ